jgi:hypothetical protein
MTFGISRAENPGPIQRDSREDNWLCASLFFKTAQLGLMDVEVMRSAIQ